MCYKTSCKISYKTAELVEIEMLKLLIFLKVMLYECIVNQNMFCVYFVGCLASIILLQNIEKI